MHISEKIKNAIEKAIKKAGGTGAFSELAGIPRPTAYQIQNQKIIQEKTFEKIKPFLLPYLDGCPLPEKSESTEKIDPLEEMLLKEYSALSPDNKQNLYRHAVKLRIIQEQTGK